MSHAPTRALSARHQQLRTALAARDLDGLVVTSLPNILYLTNFTGSSAIVVVTRDRLCFVTDFRYVTAIQDAQGTASECPGLELVKVDSTYDATLTHLLTTLSGVRIGFEAANLTVARHSWLTNTLAREKSNVSLVPTEGVVEAIRVRKDEYEIETLREAGRRLARVARAVHTEVKVGRTEREVAAAIDRRITDAGFSKTAFDTIVAGGPNAALPHAHPTNRKFVEGDLVVLDFGGVYDSYCVDLTRTVVVGRASDRTREVYHAVLEAHDRAIETVAPGQSRFAIDAAARDVLGRYGLAEAFGHGTGHGLGVEVHEEPRITRPRPGDDVADAASLVKTGMVFTIEPGAYLAGWGGVRIEDDVLVTEAGVEVLTDVPTGLIET